METRAHHLLIGSFAIGIAVLTVLFLLWIGKAEFNKQYQIYDLRFEGSVSGLSKAADVLYNGIKVGEVVDLKLDEDDPNNVLVRIQVDRMTPVKEDSYASLETQGLTGVAAVLIAGGSPKSNPLVAGADQEYPMIETRKSTFQKLFAGAPELINRGNAVLDRLSNFLSGENEQKFADTIAHVERLSGNLAKASDKFESIATNVDKLVAGDAKATLADVRGVAADIRQVMNEARVPLRDFARAGLPELLLAISDARQMIASIDRAAQRLESSPSSLIFGDKAVEYKSQGGR
ncbi:MAG: MlaD family protein [Alphaproteobacteria bacterium]|jgi:phospholipid/cholesterol/gamma-HCH transport system substrate-binding protein|nr:MlaD family protein [Alphaproteobacteria bacterium]